MEQSDGFSHSNYGYLVPADNGRVARIDLATFQVTAILDLSNTDLYLMRGFKSGYAAGGWGYVRNSNLYGGGTLKFN